MELNSIEMWLDRDDAGQTATQSAYQQTRMSTSKRCGQPALAPDGNAWQAERCFLPLALPRTLSLRWSRADSGQQDGRPTIPGSGATISFTTVNGGVSGTACTVVRTLVVNPIAFRVIALTARLCNLRQSETVSEKPGTVEENTTPNTVAVKTGFFRTFGKILKIGVLTPTLCSVVVST